MAHVKIYLMIFLLGNIYLLQGMLLPPTHPLIQAARAPTSGELKKILHQGVQTDYCGKEDQQNYTTPLAAAIFSKCSENFVLLLFRPLNDINTRLPDGNYPLHYVAMDDGRYSYVKLLLDAGAHINALDKEGRTPLGIAAVMENNATAGCLSEHAFRNNILCKDGTPLMYVDKDPYREYSMEDWLVVKEAKKLKMLKSLAQFHMKLLLDVVAAK
jgi:ankyrin repeat protein